MKKDINEITMAAVEINEVMKYAPIEYRLKLNSKYRHFLKLATSITDYKWTYDRSKKLYEQNLSTLSIKMLNQIRKDINK